MFFFDPLAFSMIQWMLAFWAQVPLPSLNPGCTLEVLCSCIFFFFASLKDFKHYLSTLWNECNCVVVCTFFGIDLLWDWNENWPFQSCGHCWIFQISWHIEFRTFTASTFKTWNSSAGIPSPLVALFTVMLPKAHLILDSRMSGSKWMR